MVKIEDIALTLVPKLSNRAVVHLLEVFGGAEQIFAASREQLVLQGLLREDVAEAIVARSEFETARKILERCCGGLVEALCSTDNDFSQRLAFTDDYPHIIYKVGNASLMNNPLLCAFTGDYEGSSSYGEQMTLQLVEQMAQAAPETVIVADLENRLAMYAVHCALDCSLRVIAVTRHPLWNFAELERAPLMAEIVASGGLVVSQSAFEPVDSDESYKRIVAGLSDGVVVVEGRKIPLAQCADSYHRALFAVPGRVTDSMSQGANRLIATSMARMATSGRYIVEQLELE